MNEDRKKQRGRRKKAGLPQQARLSESSPRGLKGDLHRELHNARIASGEDLVVVDTRQRRRIDDRVHVIKGVERFEPELPLETFGELDVLEQ